MYFGRLSFSCVCCANKVASRALCVLPFKNGGYKSAIISVDADIAKIFENKIANSVVTLKDSGKSCIYLHVPIQFSECISTASLHGFTFHHAEGNEAVLLRWLLPMECKVPPFATHQCGVGSAVMSGDDILLVRENSKIYSDWKLPGGFVNLGEDISAAAEREVREETAVHSKFESILSFRQTHGSQFGRSDMYIICRLQALSTQITMDNTEIEDAKWWNLRDFKRINKHPMLDVTIDLLLNNVPGMSTKQLESVIAGRPSFTLHFVPSLPQLNKSH